MKKLRAAVLVHETLVPPEGAHELSVADRADFQTELDVGDALTALGHEVQFVGVSDELAPIRNSIAWFDPHVIFNLLEEFREQAIYDAHVVGYLELKRAPYTGCNPRGLTLARDKALSKKILAYHRIRVPRFHVFPRHRKIRRPKHLEFPLIVKSLIEEGSYGIAQASLVTNDKALADRVSFIHETIRTDAVVEQYIDGREVYSAVLGNHRLQVLPTWEIMLDKLPEDAARIATRKVKWDLEYQEKHDIRLARAELTPELERRIVKLSRRITRNLGIDGYVRIDYRLTADGELYFLEANPNPDIADFEEFASAAAAAGMSYEALIQRIVNLGIRRAEKG
ncbi:MAG: D-alanine--D-alanine ligase [Deltaproteobacteria bacterium]|nr:MAG: D-alanine--D-alanine ligase [Deltaproteobacteria bacterium]